MRVPQQPHVIYTGSGRTPGSFCEAIAQLSLTRRNFPAFFLHNDEQGVRFCSLSDKTYAA